MADNKDKNVYFNGGRILKADAKPENTKFNFFKNKNGKYRCELSFEFDVTETKDTVGDYADLDLTGGLEPKDLENLIFLQDAYESLEVDREAANVEIENIELTLGCLANPATTSGLIIDIKLEPKTGGKTQNSGGKTQNGAGIHTAD